MTHSILLVDDEEMITSALGKLLTKKGYEVTIVNDGREAVELSKTNNYDLLITDIRMPHLDGISTLKLIRGILEDSGRKQIPEIIITGYAKEEALHEAEHLDVADCLYKPIDIWALLKSIKKAIELHQV